jgi:DNA (cytosine-5)-methyltransferase 1
MQKKINWPRLNSFGDDINKPDDVPFHLCVESCLVNDIELEKIPNANEYFHLKTSLEKLNNIKEGETSRPSFKRLHRYRYSPTTCYGNNEVHLHPYLNRRISVREALRIQGVDDNYILESGVLLSKKFKMIGNGVPVPLAEAVGNSIVDFFKINLNNG